MSDYELQRGYAVYGTLREGFANSSLWDGGLGMRLADNYGIGTVDNYRLVSNNGYFPYALPAYGERIVVEVVVPRVDINEAADELRYRLDELEGYPTFYSRVVVPVRIEDEVLHCWLYTPARPERHASLPSVPGNDWLQRHGAREETWQGS